MQFQNLTKMPDYKFRVQNKNNMEIESQKIAKKY